MLTRRAARWALAPLLLAIYATLGVARDVTNALRSAGLLRLSVAVAFGATAVGALAAIFKNPRRRTGATVATLALAAAVYAAVVFPMDIPEEKLHFIEYGAVGLLAWAAAPEKALGLRRFLFAIGFTALAGFTDECIQGLLPSRHYDVRDIAFNALAGCLAITTLEALRRAAKAPALPAPDAADASVLSEHSSADAPTQSVAWAHQSPPMPALVDSVTSTK